MNFADIERRTGLSQRRLCYVLEHDLFAVGAGNRQRWPKAGEGRGNVRTFTAFEAFAIGCVGLMLEAGLHRAVVRDCMARIHASTGDRAKNLLLKAYTNTTTALLEIGDRTHYRFRADSPSKSGRIETQWCCLATGRRTDNYKPYVCTSLDVARLREDLKE